MFFFFFWPTRAIIVLVTYVLQGLKILYINIYNSKSKIKKAMEGKGKKEGRKEGLLQYREKKDGSKVSAFCL